MFYYICQDSTNKGSLKTNMKSKVKFDLSIDNKPLIVAEIEETDDVRDKIAYRFSKAIGRESFFAYMKIEYGSSNQRLINIEPITDSLDDLENLKMNVISAIERVRDMHKLQPKLKSDK